MAAESSASTPIELSAAQSGADYLKCERLATAFPTPDPRPLINCGVRNGGKRLSDAEPQLTMGLFERVWKIRLSQSHFRKEKLEELLVL